MDWVCWLTGGMVIAVVLGHFGWVLIARIFGYQVKTLRAGKAAGRPCPRCRSAALTPQGMCMLCGYSTRAPALPTVDSEGLTRTAGYLTRLLNSGLIDPDTHSKVQSAIRAEQKQSTMQGLLRGGPQARSPHLPPPLPPLPAIPVTGDPEEHLVFDERGALVESPGVLELPDPLTPVARVIPDAPPSAETAGSAPAAPPRPPPPRFTPPAPPRKPRRTLSEVFAVFMEENNIRWGELVGGLLIVGCSVALVLSFWGQIQALPWLQFSIFTAVTAGLFGLGLYTEHRWKLPTTSRGILLISTLLVPLNFLAFAEFSKGQTPGALTLGAELVAFALFGWLVWQAAKVIAPFWPAMLTVGVCGLSASLLALRYAGGTPQLSTAQLYGFAALPVGCYGALSAWMLRRARQWKTIHAPGANAILLLLGVLSFGTILALGLLVAQRQDRFAALRRLAPLISLAGVPALTSGLLLWRRVTGASLAKLRTTGTAVAVAGAGILLAGIALAWPDPAAMLPVAACDFIVLTALALLYDIPAAHALAVPCLILAWLLGFHVARGHVQWVTADARQTLDALLNPIGGTALVPLVLLLAGAREWFLRRRRVAHAHAYGIAVILSAALSVAMVTWGGFARTGDPLGATWVYLVYAALAFALAWKANRIEAAWTGWGMLVAAIIQGFVAHRLTQDPWPNALLTAAAIATGAEALSAWFGEKSTRLFRQTSRLIAIATAGAAMTVALAGISDSNGGRVSVTVFIAAAIVFAIAFIEAVPALFVAAQALLAGGLVLAVTARLAGQPWFLESSAPLLEPWTIQAQAVALALSCLTWTIFRLVLKSGTGRAGLPSGAAQDGNDGGEPSIRNRLVRLAESRWPLDRGLSAVLLLALLGLSLAGVGPAIAAGLSRGTAAHAESLLGARAIHASGAGSWWLLATLIAVFAGAWLESLRLHSTGGFTSAKPREEGRSANRAGVVFAALALLITLWAACPLLAAREAGVGASAAAMRWLAAFFILLGSVPLWLRRRLPSSLGLGGNDGNRSDWAFTQLVRGTLDILGMLPVLVLTGYPAIAALSGESVTGPSAASFFARIGPSLSYAIPLLIVALVLVGNAIRERSPSHAFAASLVLSFTATLAYLLSLTTSREPLSTVRLFQINSLTMSAFALAWLAARAAIHALGHDPGRIPGPLKVQVRIGLGLSMLVILAVGLLLIASPLMPGPHIMKDASEGWGWPAILATIFAAVWRELLQRGRPTFRTLGLCGMALATMIGISLVSTSRQGWLGYHAILASNATLVWAMLGMGWWLVRRATAGETVIFLPPSGAATTDPLSTGNPPARGAAVLSYQRPASSSTPTIVAGVEMLRREAIRWAFGIGMFAVALGVRAMVDDPAAPWWSMGAALAVALLATTIACWGSRPAFLYASGLLLNLTAFMWFASRSGTLSGDALLNLLCVQAIAAALPGVAWIVLELQVFRRSAAIRPRGWPPYHHVAALGAGVLCAVVAALMLMGQVTGHGALPSPIVMWLAMLAAAGLFAVLTLDRTARFAVAGLYIMGLTTLSAGLALATTGDWLVWRAGIALGLYTLATAAIWNQRDRIPEALHGLGISSEPAEAGSRTSLPWLTPANLCVAAAVLAIAFWSDFTFSPIWVRLLTAAVAILQAIMLALLTERNRESSLRPAALLTLCAAAVAIGWAWLDPHGFLPLERLVVVFTIFAVITAFSAIGIPRILGPDSLWTKAARTLTQPLTAVTAICLAGILLLEGFGRATVPGFHVSTPMMLAVLVALLAGCAGAIVIALWPGATTGLSDRLRVRCVYAAEALLALAFVHLRLTEPQLFGGVFQQYWPLIVMAIAFAGVGAGELFARQQHLILSQPLVRTGIFLPLLPVIGWLPGPHVQVSFAGLLLTVCVFYAMLAALRRSFTFGLIAAMAANGALWSVLSGMPGWDIAKHPQVWLIPAALSVLAAAQLNRDRLTPDALRTLRYGCLLAVYVSSTADVFLNGVATAPWLPLVLAVLSIAGVLVGVMFRVRPFLYLGTSFLALAVVTMIYYASSQLHWTWIWYVAGILLGAAIIVLFALFEKKRAEVLALVEGLKQWQ